MKVMRGRLEKVECGKWVSIIKMIIFASLGSKTVIWKKTKINANQNIETIKYHNDYSYCYQLWYLINESSYADIYLHT